MDHISICHVTDLDVSSSDDETDNEPDNDTEFDNDE